MNQKLITLLIIAMMVAGCQYADNVDSILGTNLGGKNVSTYTSGDVTQETSINETQNNTAPQPIVEPFFRLHPGNFSVYFLDSFTAAIITPESKLIIIDTGESPESEKNIQRIRDLGYGKADYLIITNDRSYRMGGAATYVQKLQPTNAYYSGVGNEANEDYRLTKPYLTNFTNIPNDKLITDGEIQIKMLVPYDDGQGFQIDSTQNSITVVITYRGFSITFGSDCVNNCEDRTLYDSNIKAQVLAMPLQGRCEGTTSTSTYFLKQASAEINVGDNVCETVKQKLDIIGETYYDTKDNLLAITSNGDTFSKYEVKK